MRSHAEHGNERQSLNELARATFLKVKCRYQDRNKIAIHAISYAQAQEKCFLLTMHISIIPSIFIVGIVIIQVGIFFCPGVVS